MKAETVGKTLRDVKADADALVGRFSDTLSEVVAKTNAETLTCVEVKAPRLTEADTVSGLHETQLSTH